MVTSRPGTLTRRFLVGGSVALVLAVWSVLGASPVLADVFTVAIVAEPAADQSATPPFMEGFQIAVDQSPDVSHPPDTEGGDHLGSMDVEMVVVDASLTQDEQLAAIRELTDIGAVPIIVVDVAPEVLELMVAPVTDSGTMLISMLDTGDHTFEQTPLLFLAAENEGALELLSDRVPTFEDVYLAAYGRPPTPAAARGYIAGRLVDISVGATDRNPLDTETLAAALAAATGEQPTVPDPVGEEGGTSVETTVPSPEQVVTTTVPALAIEELPASNSLWLPGAVILGAIIAVGVWLMRRRRAQTGT